jgi:CHC2 zinc finger
MEIQDIKERLSITQVLRHYGLQSDKNNRLLCPFHNDKTPSLQIYPKTNTFCCFSSNCSAGTGDAIQFIQLKENCSKHEAILKANPTRRSHTQGPHASGGAVPDPRHRRSGPRRARMFIYAVRFAVQQASGR